MFNPNLPYPGDENIPVDETPEETWNRLYPRSTEARDRAELNASLTLPEVYPPDGVNADQLSYQQSYQSIGNRGLNCFVNKVSVALFRPSTSFFRLRPTRKGQETFFQANPSATLSDLENALAAQEREAGASWTQRGEHHKIHQALSHIAITGQAVIWWDEDLDSLRVIPFAQYVLQRTATGKLDTLVIAEALTVKDLNHKLRELVLEDFAKNENTSVTLYTRVRRGLDGDYTVDIGVDNKVAPESFQRRYTALTLPFAVPYWKLMDGCSYAVSMVDGLCGDLATYAKLCEAMTLGSLALLDWRILVNPGGQTTIEDLKDTETGEAVPGLPTDIGLSTTGDPNALQYVQALSQVYERRLSAAFLLDQGVFREGERVTATEIQQTVNSLEAQYAGLYAALAHEFQAPLARWVVRHSGIELDDSLEVTIVTGFDSISRANDMSNLIQALTALGQLQQLPPTVVDRFNIESLAKKIGDGFGVDLSGVLLTEEEYQQKQQALQQQQLAMQVAAQQAVQQPPEQG